MVGCSLICYMCIISLNRLGDVDTAARGHNSRRTYDGGRVLINGKKLNVGRDRQSDDGHGFELKKLNNGEGKQDSYW